MSTEDELIVDAAIKQAALKTVTDFAVEFAEVETGEGERIRKISGADFAPKPKKRIPFHIGGKPERERPFNPTTGESMKLPVDKSSGQDALRRLRGGARAGAALGTEIERLQDPVQVIREDVLTPIAEAGMDLEARISGIPRSPLTDIMLKQIGETKPSMFRALHKDFAPSIKIQLPVMGGGMFGEPSTINLGKTDELIAEGLFFGGPGALERLGGKGIKKGSKFLLKQFMKTEASLLPRASQKVVPEFMAAWSEAEAGKVLNPVIAYGITRDAGRQMWKRAFDEIENVVLAGAEKAQIKGWLKQNFGTMRMRMGEEYAQHIRSIHAQKALSKLDVMATGKTLKNLTPEQAKEATRYLSPREAGAKADRGSLTDDVVRVLDEKKAEIQPLLQESADLGIISQQVANEYINGWLPRLFANPDFRKPGLFRKPIQLSKIHYRKDAYGVVADLDGGVAEAKTLMKRIGDEPLTPSKGGGKPLRAELDEVVATTGEKKGVLAKFGSAAERDEYIARYRQAYGKKAKVRDKFDPLTEDELDALGEIVDPRQNLYEALATLRTNIAKEKMFRNIAGTDAMATFDAAVAEQRGWVQTQIPATRRMGSLRGAYLRPDVFRDIQGFTSQMVGRFQRTMGFLLSEWKAGKTVWSARTQARNFLGNIPHAIFADNIPPWVGGFHNIPHYAEGLRSMGPKGKYFREMVERNILGVTMPEAELGMMARMMETTPANAGAQGSLFWKIAKQFSLTKGVAGKALGKGYSFGDNWYKSSSYAKQRAIGQSADEAASWVNQNFQNYEEVGDLVKRISGGKSPEAISVLGSPFSRFTAEATRIHYNALKNRPVKLAMVYGLFPYVTWQAARATTGMSDEEAKAIGERGPLNLPIPFRRNDDGNVETLPLDYIFPLGQIANAWIGTRYNQDDPQVRKWNDRLGNFFLGNPIVTIPIGLSTGIDLFTGYEYRTPGETQTEADFRFAMQQLSPGNLYPPGYARIPVGPSPGFDVSRDAGKVRAAIEGRNFLSGQKRDAITTVLDSMFGLQKIPFDPKYEGDKAKRTEGYFRGKEARGKARVKRSEKAGVITKEEADERKEREEAIQGAEQKEAKIRRLRTNVIKALRRGDNAAANRARKALKRLTGE